ncbi:MAG: hypothetical protein K2L17_11110 [Muribaculaceae bacterium]|nr:hypothetical protein [Muribaculaceae bacterium]
MNISTIVTYTIRNDESRNALVEILENLGYSEANDQSTMISSRKIPKTTIDTVNKFCHDNIHDFEDGDIITTFASYIKEGKSIIKMLDYYYESKKDEFI